MGLPWKSSLRSAAPPSTGIRKIGASRPPRSTSRPLSASRVQRPV
jgi:hypothetical protein